MVAPGTSVELTYLRHGEKHSVTLTPVEAADWFSPDRGFLFEQLTFERKARSVGDALALGGQETLDNLTIVFRSVKKLSTNQGFDARSGRPLDDHFDGLARGRRKETLNSCCS